MKLTDEEFREEYKPLYIPAHYQAADIQENKIVYALAQLGEGTVTDVMEKLEELEPNIGSEQFVALAKQALTRLYDKGLIKGEDRQGVMCYNLGKITEANNGAVNPGRLSPGLD
jgi:predicted transcriptional regulator